MSEIELEPISKAETMRYMGIKGEPSGAVLEILDRYEPIVRERLRPAMVWKTVDVRADGGVYLSGMGRPLEGEDIKRHLKGCERAVVFAVTVSAEADKLIRQLSVTNMAESFAVDCLCSTAVEQVCEIAEREIFSQLKVSYRTWRFSPGYGDLPVSIQGEILELLNAQRRIGLTVTESSLLVPSKSVTAIIGVSERPIESRKKRGCEGCSMRETCAFRSMGEHCNSSEN